MRAGRPKENPATDGGIAAGFRPQALQEIVTIGAAETTLPAVPVFRGARYATPGSVGWGRTRLTTPWAGGPIRT